MGEAHRQLGDARRASEMHEEALAIARQGGMSYIGAIILGHRALAADNDGLRRQSLREGEEVLSQASVAHNAALFYPFAIESCLLASDWREARRFADGLAERFKIELSPTIEFHVERGRLLAELGERGPGEPLAQALENCRRTGREQGIRLFLALLDKALDEARSISPGPADPSTVNSEGARR